MVLISMVYYLGIISFSSFDIDCNTNIFVW